MKASAGIALLPGPPAGEPGFVPAAASPASEEPTPVVVVPVTVGSPSLPAGRCHVPAAGQVGFANPPGPPAVAMPTIVTESCNRKCRVRYGAWLPQKAVVSGMTSVKSATVAALTLYVESTVGH